MIQFLEGNEAIVQAAVDAGCRFFAGYPITPATSILTGLIRELPKVGGVAIQAEDELASIGMCIGASMAGLRVMTATSGPGMSLYSENLGLAIMGETPLVIVDSQRQGPATGSATQGADGDIQFLRWGTSGGFPLFVLSPENVTECYVLTVEAFALAERFRSPVILASQKEIGLLRERFDLEEARRAAPEVPPRTLAPAEEPFLPHRFTDPADVPPFSPLGGPHLVRYTTSTHDQRGSLTKDSHVIAAMVEHLQRKILDAAPPLARYHLDPQPGADILVVTYGAVARSARDAVALVRGTGRRVSLLILKTLFPVPEHALREAMETLVPEGKIVVPEMNLGQYVEELRKVAGSRAVVSVGKMNTDLLTPTEIIERGSLL